MTDMTYLLGYDFYCSSFKCGVICDNTLVLNSECGVICGNALVLSSECGVISDNALLFQLCWGFCCFEYDVICDNA
jgi:hypothetical protein